MFLQKLDRCENCRLKVRTAKQTRLTPRTSRERSLTNTKLVEASLVVHGGNLFNTLPKSIRNLTDVDLSTFKRSLDGYLSTVAYEPQSPGYTDRRRAESNSLVHINVCL